LLSTIVLEPLLYFFLDKAPEYDIDREDVVEGLLQQWATSLTQLVSDVERGDIGERSLACD